MQLVTTVNAQQNVAPPTPVDVSINWKGVSYTINTLTTLRKKKKTVANNVEHYSKHLLFSVLSVCSTCLSSDIFNL